MVVRERKDPIEDKACTVQRISTEGNRLPEVAETMAEVVLSSKMSLATTHSENQIL